MILQRGEEFMAADRTRHGKACGHEQQVGSLQPNYAETKSVSVSGATTPTGTAGSFSLEREADSL